MKVIDFGIARAVWRARLINEPVITGRPSTWPPNRRPGDGGDRSSRRSICLASVAYRLLTGHQPFTGVDAAALIHQVLNETPRSPSQWVPALGAEVDAVIARGMSKRPADRYPDVTGFADALRDALSVIAIDRRHRGR